MKHIDKSQHVHASSAINSTDSNDTNSTTSNLFAIRESLRAESVEGKITNEARDLEKKPTSFSESPDCTAFAFTLSEASSGDHSFACHGQHRASGKCSCDSRFRFLLNEKIITANEPHSKALLCSSEPTEDCPQYSSEYPKFIHWEQRSTFYSSLSSHFSPIVIPPVLDCMNSFMKYRVQYPVLLNRFHTEFNSQEMNILDDFAKQVVHKRKTKLVELYPWVDPVKPQNNEAMINDAIKEGLWHVKHRWKYHYHALLSAVDLAYKDYQLLYHMCNEKAFSLTTHSPKYLLSFFSEIFAFWDDRGDKNLVISGSDPVAFLAYRISKHLTSSSESLQYRGHMFEFWTQQFLCSASFILDVISQCRLIRLELDKRLLFHERILCIMSRAKEQKDSLKRLLKTQKEKLVTLANSIVDAREKISQKQEKEKALSKESSPPLDLKSLSHFDRGMQRNEDLHQNILTKRTKLANLEIMLKEEEMRRKRMHNRLQEITGNIRVYCRVRPSLVGGENEPVNYLKVASDDKLLVCTDLLPERRTTWGGLGLRPAAKPNGNYGVTEDIRCFIFDKVFGPEVRQTAVYNEVDDLVVSCVDGYNVCIMAYGQTGSGKTHTMVGTQEQPGVNRRAIQRLLRLCKDRHHWEYKLSISMLEVYQEDVFDLLVSPDQHTAIDERDLEPVNESTCRRRFNKGRKLSPTGFITAFNANSFAQPKPATQRRKCIVKLLSTQEDELVLQNLTERAIMTENDVLECLELGEQRRSVGSTQLNTASSRSHLILLLRVNGEHKIHRNHSRGTLILADLAGSENVTKSGSVGRRFQEAACINKSLCCLGRVFDSLRRHQKPAYRETKLTYLLKPTLGGDSKCLLFINLRAEPENVDETLRAINFGQGALQIAPWKTAAMHDFQQRALNSNHCFLKQVDSNTVRRGGNGRQMSIDSCDN